jgi:hypothetical protein
MVDVPAGKRLWKCPDCGREVLLSVTQLDPLACEECLAKLKGNRSPSAAAATPLALPGLPILLAIGGGLLVFGLIIGFVAGRMSVPPPPFVRPTRPAGETARSTEPTSPDSAWCELQMGPRLYAERRRQSEGALVEEVAISRSLAR